MAAGHEPITTPTRSRRRRRLQTVDVNRWADRLAVVVISLAGLAGIVVAVYLVIVLGLGHDTLLARCSRFSDCFSASRAPGHGPIERKGYGSLDYTVKGRTPLPR